MKTLKRNFPVLRRRQLNQIKSELFILAVDSWQQQKAMAAQEIYQLVLDFKQDEIQDLVRGELRRFLEVAIDHL